MHTQNQITSKPYTFINAYVWMVFWWDAFHIRIYVVEVWKIWIFFDSIHICKERGERKNERHTHTHTACVLCIITFILFV